MDERSVPGGILKPLSTITLNSGRASVNREPKYARDNIGAVLETLEFFSNRGRFIRNDKEVICQSGAIPECPELMFMNGLRSQQLYCWLRSALICIKRFPT